jgi:UDPglucose 6-dehydrogenase
MNISIIGTGYVGLVTGTCLASAGHNVTCVDINPHIVSRINRGQVPIHEPGLAELLSSALASGKLRATTDAASAVLSTDVTFICVGTPAGLCGVDLSYIRAAAETVGEALARKAEYHVVAVKSTVLPGTTEETVKTTLETVSGRRLGNGWGLCMNPEFLREGQAVSDFLLSDRIVIGASDNDAAQRLSSVYGYLSCPKIITSLRTAEMIKYVANSLFATMISFSNEIANLCSAIPGINAQEVWKGVHLDRRLTSSSSGSPSGIVEYLWHGLGFGGSCFPKDVSALRGLGKHLGASTPILDAVLTINDDQRLRMMRLLEQEIDVRKRTIAVLGLAFKPGTDDLRESPALPIIETLLEREANVIAHDPVAIARAKSHPVFRKVTLTQNWLIALNNAHACCVVTAWPEYQSITPQHFRTLMRNPLVIDGRGIFNPEHLRMHGVAWRGIGYTPEDLVE